MKAIIFNYFKRGLFKTNISFFCLNIIVNSNFAQFKPERIQNSDPDTVWVSPNRQVFYTTSAIAQQMTPFNASTLIKPGDEVRYGSYIIRKIGERVFQINDPGDKSTRGGGWGVDMYLVCGTKKALLIDLGNNYITGYEKDLIKARRNAAEELLSVIEGLAGKLPLEIAVTHMHPDHDGMTAAFNNRKVTFWAGAGEDLNALKTQHTLDPSIYKTFIQGEKSFDLGDGRIVETFLVRGAQQWRYRIYH